MSEVLLAVRAPEPTRASGLSNAPEDPSEEVKFVVDGKQRLTSIQRFIDGQTYCWYRHLLLVFNLIHVLLGKHPSVCSFTLVDGQLTNYIRH